LFELKICDISPRDVGLASIALQEESEKEFKEV